MGVVLTGIRALANRGTPSSWILAGVLLVQTFLSLEVGVNPLSRLAGMAAFCRTGSLEISDYVRDEKSAWTLDWARTPEGKTYSNKAPGGVLLGIPVFCALERVLGAGGSVEAQHAIRHPASWVLSVLFQILPLGFLILRLKAFLPPDEKQRIALVLVLGLGTTAALFMNTWFGHGLTAVLSLAVLLALLSGSAFWAGILVGFGVLVDYSSLLALPALLCVGRVWNWRRFALGLLPGVLAFGLVHGMLFGAPWILVQKFQNPTFVDVPSGSPLFGIFHSFPRGEAVLGLLFGFERGILWTQPIVFLGLLWGFQRGVRSERDELAWRFSVVYFALLFLMNATFGAWHAGGSAGPRYLSAALPLLGYFGVRWLPRARAWVWGTLAVSVAFGILVFATTQTPGRGAIWSELLGRFPSEPGIRYLRLAVAVTLLGGTALNALRLMSQNSLSPPSQAR